MEEEQRRILFFNSYFKANIHDQTDQFGLEKLNTVYQMVKTHNVNEKSKNK